MSGMVTHSILSRGIPCLSRIRFARKSEHWFLVMIENLILPGIFFKSAKLLTFGYLVGLTNHHMCRNLGSTEGAGSIPPRTTPVILAPPALATAMVLG